MLYIAHISFHIHYFVSHSFIFNNGFSHVLIFNIQYIVSPSFSFSSNVFHHLFVQTSSAGRTGLPFQVKVFFSPNSRNVTSSGPHPLLDLRQYPDIIVAGNNIAQVRGGAQVGGGTCLKANLSCDLCTVGGHQKEL